MDRLATPTPTSASGDTGSGSMPEQTARDLSPGPRPRYEPRNMTFADGLDRWALGGTFSQHASQAHWADYTGAVAGGAAVLSAAVPEPAGFAFLAPGDLRRRLPRRRRRLPRPDPHPGHP